MMSSFMRRVGSLLIHQKGSIARSCVTKAATSPEPVKETAGKPNLKKQDFTNVEGLKEFFDEENFGEQEVRSGRHWMLDELRIKSNTDLHKLWYVLLKEYNMLLTLERAAKEECEAMPNPERIDRVQISMKNLESVVQERNKAYFDLEVGETGGQPQYVGPNWMGLTTRRPKLQHVMPQIYNKQFQTKQPLPFNDRNQSWFLNHYREVRNKIKKAESNRAVRHVRLHIRRNPNVNLEVLKQRYPTVDVDSVVRRLRGEL